MIIEFLTINFLLIYFNFITMKKFVIRFIYKKLSYYEKKIMCILLKEDILSQKRRAYDSLIIACVYVKQAFEILFPEYLSDLLL